MISRIRIFRRDATVPPHLVTLGNPVADRQFVAVVIGPDTAPDIDVRDGIARRCREHILHVRIHVVNALESVRHSLVLLVCICGFVKNVGIAFVEDTVFFKRVKILLCMHRRHKTRNSGMRLDIFGGRFRTLIGTQVFAPDSGNDTAVRSVTEKIFVCFLVRDGTGKPTEAVSRIERVLFGDLKVPNGHFHGNFYRLRAVIFNGHFRCIKSGRLIFSAPNGYPEALICIRLDIYTVQVGAVAADRDKHIGIPARGLQFAVIASAINIMLIVQSDIFNNIRTAVQRQIGHGNAHVLRLFVGLQNELHPLALVFGERSGHDRLGGRAYMRVFSVFFRVRQQIYVFYPARFVVNADRASRKQRNCGKQRKKCGGDLFHD